MNRVRICSWNINGLRSIQHPLKSILDSLTSDIICIQETKTTPDIITVYTRQDIQVLRFSVAILLNQLKHSIA
uniref:DNA-(apurinic or apyrimidinic site) endonuclease n=1 Tax=Schistosoma mansoni TaxID=6183 RepID=A0A5K4EUV4_SCHMA